MGNHQGLAGRHMGRNFVPVGLALDVVGYEDHYDIRGRRHLSHIGHGQTFGGRGFAAATAGVKAHHNLLAIVPEIEGVGVALAPVANDAYRLSFQYPQVRVLIVVNVYHQLFVPSLLLPAAGANRRR